MKKITFSFLSAAIIVLGGCNNLNNDKKSANPPQQSAALAAGSVIVSPNDTRDYKALTLENDIVVLLVSDPSIDKSAASLSVGVGLLQDPMTQQGMAHYLEHMLFMGTEKYPDVAGYSNYMSKNGGSSNAYTWLDITNYMFEINNDAYDGALDRFSDFFKTPKLYPEYTDKEKNAVNAEWSMRREMDFFGMFKLDRAMMGDHPANRFLIGNLETLSDKDGASLHQQTVDFYNQYYSANIMKVAMVSNLPIADMETLAKKHFSSIKNKHIEQPAVTAKLNFAEMSKKRIHYVPNKDIKQLIIDFTVSNNVDKYATKPNQFLSYLIGSEMPGTPAYELKKVGLIAGLTALASPEKYGNYGQFSISVNLTDAGMQKRELIIAVVMNYIDKVRKQGIDNKYFKEIKTSLANQFRFLEKANSFGYVSNLADEMQTYPVQEVISAPFTYQNFNANDVKAVLDQLTPERLRIWYISQSEPHDSEMHFYDGKYKIADISSEEIASWSKPTQFALTLPKVNTLLPENFALKSVKPSNDKPEVVFDKDGIKVWQYPSKAFAQQPKGVLRVYFNNPAAQQSIESLVLLSIWQDLYQLKQSALATEASIAGMNMNLSSANGMELTISGFTDKQPLLLEKALQAMTFEVDENGFKQAVDRFVRGINNQQQQFPISQLFRHFNKLTSRSGYPDADLVQTAKSLNAKQLSAFMHQVLANNQIRVFAFGNYDQADIKHLVKQITARLPTGRKVTEYTRSKKIAPQSGQTLSLKEDLQVADVAVFDFYVHPQPTLTQEARARVLQSHLRTQTFETLRTEEQLAYAVTGTRTKIKDFTALGFAIQTPVKDVQAMQARFDAFKSEYQQKLNTLSAEDFAKLKSAVLIALKEKPKNLSEELQPMLSDWYQEKWGFNTRHKLIAEVKKVSLDDIKTVYTETIGNPNAARISIQLRGNKFKDKGFAKLTNEVEIKDLADYHKTAKYQQ